MRNIFLFAFLLLISDYIIFSCANMKPPDGGPRDTIPPNLIKSIPENKSLNYKGNSVNLTFDEILKIDNLNSNLIITPYFDSEFEYDARKNYVNIEFENEFKDSTTYTLNFQEAIGDITENNSTLDNVLAFSTGPYIDSIRIFGSIKELLTGKELKNITIGLYKANDTSDLFIGHPTYFTKTDITGKYFIENIKNDRYRIAAFNDDNKNLKCDLKSESYAFLLDTLDLNDQPDDSIYLNIQWLDISNIEIQRKAPAGKYYEVRMSKHIIDYHLNYDSVNTIFSNLISDNKIIRFYNTFPDDSLKAIIAFFDSVGNERIDTLFIKFSETKRKKEKFSYAINPANKAKIFPSYLANITFSKPVISINYDSLYFKYDSTTFSYFDPENDVSWNKEKTELTLSHLLDPSLLIKPETDTVALDPGSKPARKATGTKSREVNEKPRSNNKLILYLGNGAFVSAENDSSNSTVLSYSFYGETELSMIKGSIETEFNSFFIQLLNKNFELIDEIFSHHEFEFKNIEPGGYLIRVLVDNNNNGKWEPGNYYRGEQNEDVHFYPESITLRANWEVTDINLAF